MHQSVRHIMVALLVGVTAATVRADVGYRIFDEFADKQWKDAKVHLNYYAIQMRNEPMANALVVLHPARDSKTIDLTPWAWCIRNYLVDSKHVPVERIAFFVGEPEDKLTVRLWLGISKRFPEPWAKANVVQPLTFDAPANGKPVCAAPR